MTGTQAGMGEQVFLSKAGIGELIEHLQHQGYTVVGPRVVDGVVCLRPIGAAGDLARGRRDEQDGGRYRLGPGDAEMYFEYVVGPESPKRYLYPPSQRLFKTHVQGEELVLDAGPPQPAKLALLGIRPCELAAIGVQDRVFGVSDARTFRCEWETYYQETRRQALLIVINCTRPSGTCFCASMGTGPQVKDGYDLALTELRAGFLIQAGSPRGAQVLSTLSTRAASAAELELAELKLDQARTRMGRHLDTRGIFDLLTRAVDHPRWDDVAKRCLSCGNCTLVCPTCFCSTVTDSSDLSGGGVTRCRQWESCYTHQFSYTTAGPVRNTIRGRYRHWLRHKLCTWWEQFGSSGCVGCGRCITWCPVGIDLTAEVAAIRGQPPESPPAPPLGSSSATPVASTATAVSVPRREGGAP